MVDQYFAYMTWLPQFLVDTHGLSQSAATVGYAVPVVTLIIVGLSISSVIRRGVPIAPLLIGSLCIQAAVWLAIPYTDTVLKGAVSLVFYGIGIGITPVCLFALPSTILGASRTGPSAIAVLMTGRNLGVLVGPMLLPQVLIWTGDWSLSGLVFGGVTVVNTAGAILMAVILFRLGRVRPE